MAPDLNRILWMVLLMSTLANSSASETAAATPQEQSRFIGIRDLAGFTVEVNTNSGETVFQSPVINAPIHWNELVVSWNASLPSNAWLQVDARGNYPDRKTKFYNLGFWSDNSPDHPHHSFARQKDAEGQVKTDTLILTEPGPALELKITVGGMSEAPPSLVRFLGISFLDSYAAPEPPPPNREAWGRIIETPERSQLSYPQEKGWCSPTSLSMVLSRWAAILQRPELDIDVPEVAAGVLDDRFGTGNWPFNTAFAGRFPGMRAYVTRFTDLAEVEDWIAAGIPVIMSAPWHLLSPGREDTGAGHLVVCIGFTEEGDPVFNDPATNLKKGQKVRHIYKRRDVINAWKSSRNTVYLVYPESARVPVDRFGHWYVNP